ncbi:MAG: hypothetical protein RL358_446 [Pseudomonadota bacterium]|jgi:integration host factor subunit beta
MNRSELIEKLTQAHPYLTKQDIELSVRLLQQAIMDGIAAGRRVEVRGFGSFELRCRSARKARNPKTGATVLLGERWVPHFKPGRELRFRVEESRAECGIQDGEQDA